MISPFEAGTIERGDAAAGFDAGKQRHLIARAIHPRVQERRPVVRLDLVERLDDVIEVIGVRDEAAVVDAKEFAGEVVNAALVVAQVANLHVDGQPQQFAFAIEIVLPAPVGPGFGRAVIHRDGGVDERPPFAPGAVRHHRGAVRQRIAPGFR